MGTKTRKYKVAYGSTWQFVTAASPQAAEAEVALSTIRPRATLATTTELAEEDERIKDGDPYPCFRHGAEYCGACG